MMLHYCDVCYDFLTIVLKSVLSLTMCKIKRPGSPLPSEIGEIVDGTLRLITRVFLRRTDDVFPYFAR